MAQLFEVPFKQHNNMTTVSIQNEAAATIHCTVRMSCPVAFTCNSNAVASTSAVCVALKRSELTTASKLLERCCMTWHSCLQDTQREAARTKVTVQPAAFARTEPVGMPPDVLLVPSTRQNRKSKASHACRIKLRHVAYTCNTKVRHGALLSSKRLMLKKMLVERGSSHHLCMRLLSPLRTA
jgi:hypothetical protein